MQAYQLCHAASDSAETAGGAFAADPGLAGRRYAAGVAVLSAAERDRRWGALQKAMRAEGWAALVVTGGPDPGPVRYLSGNPELTADCAVVMAEGRAPVLLAPADTGLQGGPGWIEEVRAAADPGGVGAAALDRLDGGRGRGPTGATDPAAGATSSGRVGVTKSLTGATSSGRVGVTKSLTGATSSGRVGVADLASAPAAVVEALGGRFELADAGPALAACRAVKSPEELDTVREAAWVADRCFEQLLETAEPGRTLRQVAADLTGRALSLGARRLEMSVATGAFVGGQIGGTRGPDDGVLTPSQPLCATLTVTGCLGYRAVLGRPVGFAPPSEHTERAARAAATALDAAVRALGPGVSGDAVHRLAAEAAASEGATLVGPIGGGIGLGSREPSAVAENSADMIAAGNAIALRVHVIDESTGEEASAADTVIIGTDTGRRLSELPVGTLYPRRPPR